MGCVWYVRCSNTWHVVDCDKPNTNASSTSYINNPKADIAGFGSLANAAYGHS